MNGQKQNRSCFFTFFIFLFALAVRLTYLNIVFDQQNFLRWLPKNFDQIALMLLDGKLHHYPTAWASFHVPLAVLYQAFDQFGLLAMRVPLVALLQSLLGACSCALLFKLAQSVHPARRNLAIYTGVLFALYYPSIYFTAIILSENSFTFLILVVFCLASSRNPNNKLSNFVCGLATGMALVIRPVLGPFLPLFLGWVYLNEPTNFRRFVSSYLTTFLLGLFVVVGTVCTVNQHFHRNGKFSFTDNGGVNFALTWCRHKKIRYELKNGESWWFSPPISWDEKEGRSVETSVAFYEQSYYFKMGLQCIVEHPERLVSNFLNLTNILSSTFYPNFIKHPVHDFLLSFWKKVAAILFAAFLLYPLVFKGSTKEWLLGFMLMLSLGIAVYLANPGEERYLVPYFFVLLLWGGATIAEIIQQLAVRIAPSYETVMKTLLSGFGLSAVLISSFQWQGGLLTDKYPVRTFPITSDHILEASKAGLQWLQNNQKADGRFHYQLEKSSGRVLKKQSTTRQLIAAHGLARMSKYFGKGDFLETHRNNLNYLKSIIREKREFSFVRGSSKWLPINETSFAILTLIDSPFAQEFKDDVKKLGEFIIHMQKRNGQFYMLYPKAKNVELSSSQQYNLQRFASGEAALACMYLYKFLKDERYLNCTRKAFEFYYPRIKAQFNASFASWHSLAYYHLFQAEKKAAYRDAVYFLAQRLIKLQNPEDMKGKIPGGFDQKQTWYTSAEAVFTDALTHAAKLCEQENCLLLERLTHASNLGLFNLYQQQIRDNSPLHGALLSEPATSIIYLDNLGHALTTFGNTLP